LALLFWTGGYQIINLLAVDEQVRQQAYVFLVWAALTPVTGVLAFQMDGVFIGATWSREMSKMMLVSLAFYLLVWWLTRESMGNHGLWLALHGFLLCRGVTLLSRVPAKAGETFGR